jgi:glucosyl-dolichyl phosphate glucuronosyltransferase
MAGTVSVIIPTKSRPDSLTEAVESILKQSRPPEQLIIIDQSQMDESRICVEKVIAGAPESVREKVKLTYINDPAISGLTVARNRAMELAQGEVWLFLDDDVILEHDYVQEIISIYARYPGVSGVSGVVTNFRRPPVGFRLWSRLFENGPFHDDRPAIYWNAENLRRAGPIRVTRLGGGLMSFCAEAIRGMKFDETLSGVSDGEDVDFCARLGPKAILTITPRARLVHNSSPVGRDMGHWLRRNVRATNYLYWRNWNQGAQNRLCFAWLNVGYLLVAAWAATRRFSLDPCHAFWNGVRDARAACLPWKAASHKAMARRARFGWRF